MNFVDPIFACDFYKVHHKPMYPEGTTKIYSNFTPRSNRLAPSFGGRTPDRVLWVGIQGFVLSFLIHDFNQNFFRLPKSVVIAKYKRRMGPDHDTTHIEELHDLGYLPLRIKSLPEGSLVGMKVPVLTITNTHPKFYWLVNYLETVLSTELWKMTTNATIAYEYRVLLESYAHKTGSPVDFVKWQGHDFSMRGLSGLNDAATGFGHLCSFLGTDTIPAMDYADTFYDGMNTFVGGSVPATEHSVMCAGGKESELETYRRLITEVHPKGIVSIVSDTWDFWQVVGTQTDSIVNQLKDTIMNRQDDELGMAKVVIRPDSGDPVKILCGYKLPEEDWTVSDCYYEGVDVIYDDNDGKYYEIEYIFDQDGCADMYTTVRELSENEVKGAVQCLWENFGGTITETGHKLLDRHIGLIYGDSITLQRAEKILRLLDEKGFASANVVFGIGSYTYQYVTRDTFGFAMKATYAEIDGEPVELFKYPVTDGGTKKSAKGLLRVEREGDKFVLYDQQTPAQEIEGELEDVFVAGMQMSVTSLEEIRKKVDEAVAKQVKSML